MPFDVHETLMACAACQKQKLYDNWVSYKFIKSNYTWHTVSVDVVGPFDLSSLRNKYLIVAIDYLTKWVEIWAIKGLTAATTAKFIFNQVICRHGCPQVILTDNGTNFAGSVLPKLNSLMCIRSALTTPYHSEANSMVKRVNSTMVDILRKLTTNSLAPGVPLLNLFPLPTTQVFSQALCKPHLECCMAKTHQHLPYFTPWCPKQSLLLPQIISSY